MARYNRPLAHKCFTVFSLASWRWWIGWWLLNLFARILHPFKMHYVLICVRTYLDDYFPDIVNHAACAYSKADAMLAVQAYLIVLGREDPAAYDEFIARLREHFSLPEVTTANKKEGV